ncbi:MAG: GntR family transcriptional regulator [Desulfobacterales bacterium]|nr:MAG: GntR family transcriptional regulator [Desulfobacterales bacterium]
MRKKAELKGLNIGPLPGWPERKSLGEHVFENLKQAVIKGDIAPGTWLVESHIAETLGISRTPVREAIHKLEREGFVQKQPRSGFTVLGLNRDDIEETFGIRSVLESYAARLAAIKHKEKELKALEKKIEEFQTCIEKKQMKILPEINTEFHDLLYALSKSPKLIQMINNLKDQIYRFRHIILMKDNMALKSNEDHRLMLLHIRKRDADGVERLVREHVLRGQEVVLQEFDRRRAK